MGMAGAGERFAGPGERSWTAYCDWRRKKRATLVVPTMNWLFGGFVATGVQTGLARLVALSNTKPLKEAGQESSTVVAVGRIMVRLGLGIEGTA